MSGYYVELEGLEECRNYFQRLKNSAENFTAVGQLIAEHLKASTHQRFLEDRDPDGKSWEALKPATVAAKVKKDVAPRILQTTNTLFKSINAEVTAHAIIVGTDVKYAAAHQFGVPERNLPRRAFLGVSDSDRTAIHQLLVDYFEDV